MPDQTLAADLEQLRLRSGLSLRELVKRCGVPRSTLSDALAGRRVPRLDTVVAVVRACGEDPEPWRRRWADSATRARTGEAQSGGGAANDAEVQGATEVQGASEVQGAAAADGAADPSTAPAELPRDLDLAGRDAELQQLGDGGVWIVHGSPGVGKTALAVHWAHRVASAHPDGQLFVNLRGHHPTLPPMSANEILARLLRSVGVAPDRIVGDIEDLARLWRTTLAGRRVLIVLDDALDAAQVRPVLPGATGSTLIVTSRRHLIELMVRDGVAAVPLGVLDESDAHTVLTQAVGAARLAAEPDAAKRVVAQCAHLPLALRLAGAVLALDPGRTLTELADALADGGRLATLEEPLTPSPVEAAFELSYRALDPATRTGFRRLGLHPGPDLGADPTEHLVDVDRREAARIVSVLTESHLIDPAGSGRYRMHDLVREYAVRQAERFDSADDRDAALTRLLDDYADHAAAVSQALCPGAARFCVDPGFVSSRRLDAGAATAWLDAQGRNVLAAIEHDARNGTGEQAWRLVDLLGVVLLRRMDVADLLIATDAGVDAARARGAGRAEATMLLNRAWLYWRSGRADAAVPDFRSALESFRAAGDRRGEAAALQSLAAPLAVAGDLTSAQEHAARAHELYGELENPHGRATTHNTLANIAMRLGDLTEALVHFRASTALLRAGGNGGNLAIALGNLTLICIQTGEVADAVEHATESVEVAGQVGDRYARTLALINGAIALEQSGRLTESLAWASDGLDEARELGDRSFQVSALDALGTATRRLGLPGAAGLRAQALELSRVIEDRVSESEVLVSWARDSYHDGLGSLLSDDGESGAACFVASQAHAREALDAANEVDSGHGAAEALVVLAAAQLALGRDTEAAEDARQAAGRHAASGARLGEARARQVLGHTLFRANDVEGAESQWRSAMELFKACDVPEVDALRLVLAGEGRDALVDLV